METVSWDRDAAAHLLRRAGFGPRPDEIDRFASMSLDEAVSTLVDYESIDNSALETQIASLPPKATLANLQLLFFWRMVFTARPLEEKMTYFWNLHWTSGWSKVKGIVNDKGATGYSVLRNQNSTERSLALGRLDDLVLAMSKDAAMLYWLDNWTNVAARPNENYARELMELFTIGIGNYTQSDVTDLARAFTGWTLDSPRTGFAFNAARHDGGTKTILGETGNFDGDDAIQILLNRRDSRGELLCGRFLGEKLFSFFAYPNPPESVVSELAAAFDSSGRSVRELVRHIFSMPEFYAPHARKSLVRSPAEFVAGSVRLTNAESDFQAAINLLGSMGQVLFDPSDAKGWSWGASWITTGSLFARSSFANKLTSNRGSGGTRFDPAGLIAGQDASTSEKAVSVLSAQLGIDDASGESVAAWIDYMNANDDGSRGAWVGDAAGIDKKVRGLVHLMLTSPDFQTA